jgi:hypothetical protein
MTHIYPVATHSQNDKNSYHWGEIEQFIQKTEQFLLNLSPLEIQQITYPLRPREMRDFMDENNLDSEEHSYTITYPRNNLYHEDNRPVIHQMLQHLKQGILKNDFYYSHINNLIGTNYPDLFFPWLNLLSDVHDKPTWNVLFNHFFSHHSPSYIFQQLCDEQIKLHLIDIIDCPYMQYIIGSIGKHPNDDFMDYIHLFTADKWQWSNQEKIVIIEKLTARVQDYYKDKKPGLGFNFNLGVDTILTISHLFSMQEDRTEIIHRLIALMHHSEKRKQLEKTNFSNQSPFKNQTWVLEQEVDFDYLRYRYDIPAAHFSNMFTTLNLLLKNPLIQKLGFDSIEFRNSHGHMAQKFLHARVSQNEQDTLDAATQQSQHHLLEKLYSFLLGQYDDIYHKTVAEKQAKDTRYNGKNLSVDSNEMNKALYYFVLNHNLCPDNQIMEKSNDSEQGSNKLKI